MALELLARIHAPHAFALALALAGCAADPADGASEHFNSNVGGGGGQSSSGADAGGDAVSSGSGGGAVTGSGGSGQTTGTTTTNATSGVGGASSSTTVTSSSSSSSGTGAGGPCKTECLGNECGLAMPDLCGGTLDCGDCGPDADYCIKLDPPVFRDAVRDAIIAIKSSHPEVFDFNDTIGSENIHVVDPIGYRDALLEALVGAGKDAIADPNDTTEIRVRGTPDEAENYHVLISSGYSAYTYTSTCAPANF